MGTFVESIERNAQYQLCFRSMFHTGHGYAFPCDAQGHVDLNALSDLAMRNYLFARGVVGWEFYLPEVERSLH